MANMTDRRMTVTLKPKSMGELAGWNLILSTYLEQGFAGGGDFQIRMDYRESDGLTMKLIKGKEKLRGTHVKREPLDVAVRVMRNTSGFTLASKRRHESPGILLEQDTGASKDTIVVEEAAQSHSKVEILLSQMRMRALLNAQFSLMEELKGARTAEHKELGAAYQKLEDAFQSALIAEGEIQRGKE